MQVLFLLQTVACVSPLPYVYVDAAMLNACALQSKVGSSFIALHEHTDTFLDKLDTALMVSGHDVNFNVYIVICE